MRRRSRVRRTAKWAGVAVCGVLLGSLLSLRWVTLRPGDEILAVNGKPVQSYRDVFAAWNSRTWNRIAIRDRTGMKLTVVPVGALDGVGTPLGLLLAGAGAVTAYLFWSDRRQIPPGHCRQCGYNLTGNVSGRCPECGTVLHAGPG